MVNRETLHPSVPEFTAPLLRRLASAFSRRAKSLKYGSSDFTCLRELEESPDAGERMNVDMESISTSTQSRLSVWSDGAMWLRICRPAKRGWDFMVSGRGNLADVPPADAVGLYERSFVVDSASDRATVLESLWSAARLVREKVIDRNSRYH